MFPIYLSHSEVIFGVGLVWYFFLNATLFLLYSLSYIYIATQNYYLVRAGGRAVVDLPILFFLIFQSVTFGQWQTKFYLSFIGWLSAAPLPVDGVTLIVIYRYLPCQVYIWCKNSISILIYLKLHIATKGEYGMRFVSRACYAEN